MCSLMPHYVAKCSKVRLLIFVFNFYNYAKHVINGFVVHFLFVHCVFCLILYIQAEKGFLLFHVNKKCKTNILTKNPKETLGK